MIFVRKQPLSAVAQEVIISLSDEAGRWRVKEFGFLDRPDMRRADITRDDGLELSMTWLAPPVPFAEAFVAVSGGDGLATLHRRDKKAVLAAGITWLRASKKAAGARLDAFLGKAR